jgi:hypothetical protein
MPQRRSSDWTIELRIYPIPQIGKFGGHMFWVLKDPDGNVREELHFFGEPGTDLWFQHRRETDIRKDNRYVAGSIRQPMLQYSAPREEILRRWQAGLNAGEVLDARPHFDYPSIWETIKGAAGDASNTNSNAGAYTIGKVMLPELVRKEKSTQIPTTGWGVDLFDYDYPGIPPQVPDDEQPNMDARPDFRNETRNEENKRQAAPANPVQLALYRMIPSDDATVAPAMRALNAAKADDAFTKRYLKGDRDVVDYMHALHRAAYPEPGSDGPNLGEAGDGARGAPRRGLPGSSDAAAPEVGSRNNLAPWMSDASAAARNALTDLTSDSTFVDRYLSGGRNEFDRFQGLMRAAYPEPDAADAGVAETGGVGAALKPWSPAVSSGNGDGVAPWLRDAFTSEATRAPGAEPHAESTLAPWMGYRKPDWLRDPGQ